LCKHHHHHQKQQQQQQQQSIAFQHRILFLTSSGGMDRMETDEEQKESLAADGHHEDEDDDQCSLTSSDGALLDMLGIASLQYITDDVDEDHCDQENILGCQQPSPLLILSDTLVTSNMFETLAQQYQDRSFIVLPSQCSIPAEYMRRLTEELIWGKVGSDHDPPFVDRTYETILVHQPAPQGQGVPTQKRVLTRLENFVDAHEGWSDLCHSYIPQLLSKVVGGDDCRGSDSGSDMVLYKEKLNIKPPGGSGFAPHLDTPSLRIAFGSSGPQTFCTVMVAIDDMTIANGCLRICPGQWTKDNHIETILPQEDGNPDAGGRAGAIPIEFANQQLVFEPLICKGGTIAIFNGWAPHRSAVNTSPFPRRAVFLTYNPRDEGDFHTRYYEKMGEKRRRWRESVGLLPKGSEEYVDIERLELEALSTIPKI
jgi:Phytanoyl-CoA dioxygenase (PhyH)